MKNLNKAVLASFVFAMSSTTAMASEIMSLSDVVKKALDILKCITT